MVIVGSGVWFIKINHFPSRRGPNVPTTTKTRDNDDGGTRAITTTTTTTTTIDVTDVTTKFSRLKIASRAPPWRRGVDDRPSGL